MTPHYLLSTISPRPASSMLQVVASRLPDESITPVEPALHASTPNLFLTSPD